MPATLSTVYIVNSQAPKLSATSPAQLFETTVDVSLPAQFLLLRFDYRLLTTDKLLLQPNHFFQSGQLPLDPLTIAYSWRRRCLGRRLIDPFRLLAGIEIDADLPGRPQRHDSQQTNDQPPNCALFGHGSTPFCRQGGQPSLSATAFLHYTNRTLLAVRTLRN